MLTPPRSLQRRLLWLVLGVVAAVWLATAAMTWRDARHELDELLDGHLAQAAALLVARQAHELDDDDHGIDAPTLHRYAPRVAFQVFHEGRLALRSANAPVLPMSEPDGIVENGFRTGFKTVQIDGMDWRVFSAQGGERDVQVFVGEQLGSRGAILWAVLRSMLWPVLVALPLLALAAGWAVYSGLAPLRRLGRTLAERQPQALEPVVVDGAPSEMQPMLGALNGLFERIAALMEVERRFTADAAHELRTPIAAIRTQAQVALGEADDAERRHALQATLEGCDRAMRLVEQLLVLSRLESSDAPTPLPVDLSALVRGVVAELAPRAIAKHQTIALDADAVCAVRADATLLAVLVRNLVDNAVRYSPAQARIDVAVLQQGQQVRLTVDDSGAGMSAPDQQRLGERFFRVLGSGQGGSGLGWSIVRRIAAVQRAELRVGTSPGLGGLQVSVAWPAPGREASHDVG